MSFILTSRDFLLEYIKTVRSNIVIRSKADEANIRVLEAELKTLAKRHRTLSQIRIGTFVLLYASLLSNFALPAVTAVVETFTLIANLVGAGILSLLALYLTWRVGQLWNRMQVVGSHMIAIYERHNKEAYPVKKGGIFDGRAVARRSKSK